MMCLLRESRSDAAVAVRCDDSRLVDRLGPFRQPGEVDSAFFRYELERFLSLFERPVVATKDLPAFALEVAACRLARARVCLLAIGCFCRSTSRNRHPAW